MIKYFRIFYVEEPVYDTESPYLEKSRDRELIWIIVPHLSGDTDQNRQDNTLRELLNSMFDYFCIKTFVAWYNNPVALRFADHYTPEFISYDSMEGVSCVQNTSLSKIDVKAVLLRKADLVFARRRHSSEGKVDRHTNIHFVPSDINNVCAGQETDVEYSMLDEKDVPGPCIGFTGRRAIILAWIAGTTLLSW